MKTRFFYLFLSLVIFPSIGFSADCVLTKELRGQKLFRCQSAEMPLGLHVLDLKGGFSETAYYHGYFLSSEIEKGALHGIQARTEKAFAELTAKDRKQLLLIKKCIIDNYRNAVSDEFKIGLKNLHRGMKDAGSKVSWKTFEESNYMVEFSIFADAMQRKLSENPGKAQREVFATCAPYFVGSALLKPFQILAKGLSSLKMGCTGIAASAASTMDGALVHGRNFDTGLLGSYEHQQVVVINRQSNGMTSVGMASAGLHYAGGISGFNNYGISVSLHELQSKGVKVFYSEGASDIAPYLLHSVLMNARTLDEAIQIIKTRKGFGAWTFLISDMKTNEAASIELTGSTVAVARHMQNTFLGQSNHFVAPATEKEAYDYSLNKTLETRSRLNHVNRTLSESFGRIDFQWVIDRLSGHHDELVGARSFGRTTTKVYTAATQVMVPARHEWWMTLPETYPTNRSHFIGFRLNPPTASSPVQILGATKAWEDPQKAAWYDSMKFYVQAYLSNEQDSKSLDGLGRTLNLLDQGILKAQEDRIHEFTYLFMSGRLRVYRAAQAIQQGQRDLAYRDLLEAQQTFETIRTHLSGHLHPYEMFQVEVWSFRAETLKPQARQNKDLQQRYRMAAQSAVEDLLRQHPQQKELHDFAWSLKQSAQLDIVLDAAIRFGTVE